MYLSRKDFNSHGYTDGCAGCRDLASGKQRAGSFLAPHNAACRKRLERAIKAADPDRWARYLLRRGQEVEAEEEERASHSPEVAAPPALEGGEAEDDDGWDELFEGLDDEEVGSGSSGLVGSSDAPSDLGAVVEQKPTSQSDDLVHRLCSVDVSEVFSPPRVGKEALKFGLEVGDAMDLTTGWDFNKEEDRVKAEERLDQQKPLVLIGSPPCVAFSQLQTLIPDSDRKRRQLAEWGPSYGVHG